MALVAFPVLGIQQCYSGCTEWEHSLVAFVSPGHAKESHTGATGAHAEGKRSPQGQCDERHPELALNVFTQRGAIFSKFQTKFGVRALKPGSRPNYFD